MRVGNSGESSCHNYLTGARQHRVEKDHAELRESEATFCPVFRDSGDVVYLLRMQLAVTAERKQERNRVGAMKRGTSVTATSRAKIGARCWSPTISLGALLLIRAPGTRQVQILGLHEELADCAACHILGKLRITRSQRSPCSCHSPRATHQS